jgi:hypothetical protein
MDKNAVEWKHDMEETPIVDESRQSETIVNVVRDAITTQQRALEMAIMRRDSNSAHHIVETLLVLESLLEDISSVCDKFGWYY